jgi:hypothetical protein
MAANLTDHLWTLDELIASVLVLNSDSDTGDWKQSIRQFGWPRQYSANDQKHKHAEIVVGQLHNEKNQ